MTAFMKKAAIWGTWQRKPNKIIFKYNEGAIENFISFEESARIISLTAPSHTVCRKCLIYRFTFSKRGKIYFMIIPVSHKIHLCSQWICKKDNLYNPVFSVTVWKDNILSVHELHFITSNI